MSGVFVFRQPPPGFITEYFGGGGGKGGTTVQSTQIPPEVLARYNAVNARAEKVADTPFQRYGGEFVAPINEQQQAGIGGINALSGQDVGPLTQQQIGYYQNPFTQAVVDPTMKALQQQQGQQRAQQQAQMAKAGAFGNSRSGLERAVLAGQQGLATSQAIAPLYAQGYQQAVQTAQGQQGVVASDLARRMQTAQAQIAAGTLQQQTAQARNTALYQQHLQEQGYPFQVAQFLANIAEGTGALSGSTTTQNKSGGFFSNRGGFKVNERPARAYGGGLDVNSMGGAVYDPGQYASGGYAEGGSPMADILAAQQAMFMGQGSPYGQGQKPGVGLGIPSQSAKITPLQVKPIAQEQRGQDPLTQAANFGKGLVEAKKAGQEIKGWFSGDKGKDATTPATGATTTTTSTPAGGKQAGLSMPADQPTGDKLAFGPQIKDPGNGLAFNTSNLTPELGGDQMADLGGADFSDVGSWFGNRGGSVPDYACGGVAGTHRDGYAGKGFVTPGYDPEVPGTDIMDTTVDEGEQSVNQLKGEQEGMNPKISGGGGGGGFDVIGTAMKALPFFLKDGGAAYREHHDGTDGNVVGEKFTPEDVAAATEEIAPTGVDPRLVALAPDRPLREMTMDPSLMASESGGNFRAKNEAIGAGGLKGHFGRGQFGQARLQDAMNAGVLPKGTTPEQFMSDPELQKATEKWHFGDIAQHISDKGLDKAIGTTINGVPVTEQGMLNVAHLGGKGGLEKFIASGGKYNPADENGTRLSDYLALGAGVKPTAPTRTASNEYAGNAAKSASIGDVVREYAPSGMPTSENFWVPALGFLGGMLTSPNRSLAGAIGSGLVSGTSGYMELRKGQQEDIKNAFNVFKERFEDAIDPTTKQPAKRDKFTGQLYAPEQAQSSLAKTLRGIGVDPANYGVVESKIPAAEKTGAKSDTSLPPPVKGEKPVEKAVEAELPGEMPPPPANLAKSDMNFQQLKAAAYHDWKNSGLTEDPKIRLARAKAHREDAAALSKLGISAGPRVAEANRMAELEMTKLNDELKEAASRQDAINKENDKLRGVSANKYGDEVANRIAKYEPTREQILALNQVYKDYMSGRSSEALANFYSWSKGLGLNMSQSDPAYFDTAMKLAMTQVVEQVQADKFQRAPASGKQIISQIVASPSADPGATYTVLGRMLGEMDYVHRRDMAYKEGTSPVKFAQEYEIKNNRPAVKDIAAGLSELEMHKNMPPDVIKSLMERYGEHGYVPKGMKDVSTSAAPTVAPGQKVGEEKQFKQGVGVWDGSKWVPKGQQ